MIGQMRQRITLQGSAKTADAGGGAALVWSDIAELWARVTPVSGSETVQAMRLAAILHYVVRLRFRSDVNSERRFIFKGRVLNIRSVRNLDERGQWLECVCEEGVAD